MWTTAQVFFYRLTLMSGVSPKCEWQLMMDYTFVRNRMPKITPAGFRRKHTKGFLEMLHPNATLDDDTLRSMETSSSDVVILSAYYDEKVELYYAKSGVSLHHLLIATQTHCVVCQYPSKPEVSRCYMCFVLFCSYYVVLSCIILCFIYC